MQFPRGVGVELASLREQIFYQEKYMVQYVEALRSIRNVVYSRNLHQLEAQIKEVLKTVEL